VTAAALGGLIFVVDYGCLFWGEQRVPSESRWCWRPPVFIADGDRLSGRKVLVRLARQPRGLFGVAVLITIRFPWAK
jgi:hypothetical protein